MLLLAVQPALADKGDYVVLLHGIGRTAATMTSLQRSLEKHGYTVLNLDYPSRKYTIEALALRLKPKIEEFNAGNGNKIHFVGYSMGGLVIQSFLAKYRPDNLGRVVVMATPNEGSEVADALNARFVYRSFFGPAGGQLTTEHRTAGLEVPEIDYDLGCIAGDRTVDPISSYILINGPDDGKVSVKSATGVKGAKDHIVVHASHTFINMNSDAIKQTRYFLEHGKFRRAKALTP
ncbi:MAG: esterase/lipase family protein [Alphaproteobacteria bacterium]